MAKRITNKEFSKKDEFFKKCCEAVDTKPTIRQASKFRNKKGLAYMHRKQVKEDE